MKSVKNLVYTALLTSLLAINVPAGEMGTPGFVAPSPTPTPEQVRSIPDSGTGYIIDPNHGIITTETSDYLLLEALAALLSMY
jgi:hypothetical protein